MIMGRSGLGRRQLVVDNATSRNRAGLDGGLAIEYVFNQQGAGTRVHSGGLAIPGKSLIQDGNVGLVQASIQQYAPIWTAVPVPPRRCSAPAGKAAKLDLLQANCS